MVVYRYVSNSLSGQAIPKDSLDDRDFEGAIQGFVTAGGVTKLGRDRDRISATSLADTLMQGREPRQQPHGQQWVGAGWLRPSGLSRFPALLE